MDQGPTSSAPKPDSGSTARQGRLLPPLWVWVVMLFAGGAIVWIRIRNVTGDHAVVNILTLICAFVAFVSLAFWFLMFSGYRFVVRLLALAGGVACVAILSAVLRIDEVTGEMVPSFRWRWTPPHDRSLGVPTLPGDQHRIDVTTSTPDDYPGFLGPNRDLRVDHLALDPDWSQHPPRLRWRQSIGAGWSAFSVVNGFAFTLEQRGDEELVTCYAAATGKLLWAHGVVARHETTMGGVGPRSTPTIDGGRVYTLGATGILQCLDGATGKCVWSDDLLKRYKVDPALEANGVGWGRAASPLVVDNLLVVPAGGPAGGPYVSLAALDKTSGRLVWEAGDRQVGYASPALVTLGNVRQILIVNENNVTGHDPADGHVLWSHVWPGGSTSSASCSQAMPVEGQRVLLSKGYSIGAELIQLEASGRGPWNVVSIWRESSLLKTKFTNVMIRHGCAYGLSDGILECVDLDTGKRKWRRGRYGHGQILGVGDLLLVQAETGEVALVEASPSQYRELGRFPALEGKTWNNLCLYGSLLLVRNAQEAACYELTLKPGPGPT